MKWAFIGFVVELYGILVLFGDFFATVAGFAGGTFSNGREKEVWERQG